VFDFSLCRAYILPIERGKDRYPAEDEQCEIQVASYLDWLCVGSKMPEYECRSDSNDL